jgi:hypothetical protein
MRLSRLGTIMSSMPMKGMCTNNTTTKSRLGCGDGLGHADFNITGHEIPLGVYFFRAMYQRTGTYLEERKRGGRGHHP